MKLLKKCVIASSKMGVCVKEVARRDGGHIEHVILLT